MLTNKLHSLLRCEIVIKQYKINFTNATFCWRPITTYKFNYCEKYFEIYCNYIFFLRKYCDIRLIERTKVQRKYIFFFKGRNMGFLFVFICPVFLHVIIYYCFWGLTKKRRVKMVKIVRGGGKLYLWAQLDHSGTQLASTAADTQLASPFLLFLVLFLNLKSSCLQM